jgi:hypothetical protein
VTDVAGGEEADALRTIFDRAEGIWD